MCFWNVPNDLYCEYFSTSLLRIAELRICAIMDTEIYFIGVDQEEPMIEVQDLSDSEISELLAEKDYGHLGVAKDNEPYVVPVNYAYRDPYFYIYTTEGLKTEMITANPKVCLQVEDVRDRDDWRSVVVRGTAVIVRDEEHLKAIREMILDINPTLTPALSVRWMDQWVRQNVEVVFAIEPRITTGRKSVKRFDGDKPFIPAQRRDQ